MAGELIAFASKAEILAKAEAFWNPDKTRFWSDSGIPLVIGNMRDGQGESRVRSGQKAGD